MCHSHRKDKVHISQGPLIRIFNHNQSHTKSEEGLVGTQKFGRHFEVFQYTLSKILKAIDQSLSYLSPVYMSNSITLGVVTYPISHSFLPYRWLVRRKVAEMQWTKISIYMSSGDAVFLFKR